MKRIFTITAAAFAVAALAGPSSALAGGSHLLGTYKVEKHLDLDGQGGAYTISCEPGDIALDGMWRIDNVDQDNDYIYPVGAYFQPTYPPSWEPAWEVLKSVEVVEAYATSIDTYRFKFVPQAGGDVQGKLFLVCLPLKTSQNNGHQHTWNATFDPTGANLTPFDSNSPACADTPNAQIAIQPGFIADVGVHPWARTATFSGSRPVSWLTQVSAGEDGISPVTQHWSCLNVRSNSAGSPSHKHKLVWNSQTLNDTIGPNQKKEFQLHCSEHYKAVLASYSMFGAYAQATPHPWFLGMDPRPKTRAFRVFNQHDSSTLPVSFSTLCFKDRTT
jgi:hypothetical protein